MASCFFVTPTAGQGTAGSYESSSAGPVAGWLTSPALFLCCRLGRVEQRPCVLDGFGPVVRLADINTRRDVLYGGIKARGSGGQVTPSQ
jgi:hypothetical protein